MAAGYGNGRTHMNCQETRLNLEAYCEGDLSGPAREAVRSHLASCEACRLEAALCEEVNLALRPQAILRAPEPATRRVLAQVSALAAERRAQDARSSAFAAGLVSTVAALGRWAAANRLRAAVAASVLVAAIAFGVLNAYGAVPASANSPAAAPAFGFAAKATAWLGTAARDAVSAAGGRVRGSLSWSAYDTAAYAFNISLYAAIALGLLVVLVVVREEHVLIRHLEMTYRNWTA